MGWDGRVFVGSREVAGLCAGVVMSGTTKHAWSDIVLQSLLKKDEFRGKLWEYEEC